VLVALAFASSPAAAQPANDEAALRAVMARFDRAILDKNLPAMRELFHEGRIVWMSTPHPATREVLARMEGRAIKPVEDQGAHQMLEDPRAKNLRFRETLGKPVIHTDGQMASITFDYDFRVNDQVQNWGKESWQLVKADGQWKIVSLLFSMQLQQVQPAPAGHAQ